MFVGCLLLKKYLEKNFFLFQTNLETAEMMIKVLIDPNHPDFERHKREGEFQLATILGNAVQRVDMRCKTCGALGHGPSECPEGKERDYKMARVTCRICGDQGHTTMDCPQKEKMVRRVSDSF
jgi:hypothetical protein